MCKFGYAARLVVQFGGYIVLPRVPPSSHHVPVHCRNSVDGKNCCWNMEMDTQIILRHFLCDHVRDHCWSQSEAEISFMGLGIRLRPTRFLSTAGIAREGKNKIKLTC